MRRFLLTVAVAILTVTGVAAEAADQALGYWKSISDVKGEEGKVTALWKLSTDSQGQLQGVIVAVPGKAPEVRYKTAKAEYDGKPVLGTVWMRGLKRAGADGWAGGTIVDIGNDKGDVYGCEIKVLEGGKKLAMRGYLGIALFGRTQTWVSADEAEVRALTRP